MVVGFESFREYFAGYEDCYTIIGGTACDILLGDAALPFRTTKDIDVILLIENKFEEFATILWKYIKDGGYRCGWKKSEAPHFYRFTEPQAGNFPEMIELFSRKPDFQLEHEGSHLTPLPVSDEISSLSAIMLDDNYYHLMLSGRRVVDGISVLDAEYLILFKAKAFLDLSRRKAEGEHVNERDIKKHKSDVFRLFQIVNPSFRIVLPEAVAAEMRAFIERMSNEQINLKAYGMGDFSQRDILKKLEEMYLQEDKITVHS